MRKERAGGKVNRDYLEHPCYEIVSQAFQAMRAAGLNQFTLGWIADLANELNSVVHELDELPEPRFREMIGVIAGLREARGELELALFLFDVEEIDPLYRLIMRNRAVLRGGDRLERVLRDWQVAS